MQQQKKPVSVLNLEKKYAENVMVEDIVLGTRLGNCTRGLMDLEPALETFSQSSASAN